MTEIKDWKGNVVKEGDEICFIKTIDRDYIHSSGFYLNGEYHEIKSKPEPDKACWEVGEYGKVHLCNGELAITLVTEDGDFTFHFTDFLSTSLAFSDTDCVVLAIKGISDTP